jgi:DNA-binding NarL/FixJ family response regulator
MPAEVHVIRVLVVDDHPLTRAGVRSGLHGDGVAVTEAGDIEAALRALATGPDVALVDLLLSGQSGLDVVRHAADHQPETRILVLSQAPVDDVLAAIRLGAHGYVSKAATSSELRHAVHAVLDGPVLPPELAARLIGAFQRPAELTVREREVLRCLAKGYDNREIANELAVAVRTVNRHLENIRAKLGHRRRSELMRFARSHG